MDKTSLYGHPKASPTERREKTKGTKKVTTGKSSYLGGERADDSTKIHIKKKLTKQV